MGKRELCATPRVFVDGAGHSIEAGDVLYREFCARRRERPGHKRVSINGMSGIESIVPDEGGLLAGERHWIKRVVGWSGSCLIADRLDYSDFQVLMGWELFNDDGERIYEGCGSVSMNGVFDSTVYVVVDELGRE